MFVQKNILREGDFYLQFPLFASYAGNSGETDPLIPE